MKDTFERFAPPERGRFGDNEQRHDGRQRVAGACDLVDVEMRHFIDMDRAKAIFASKDGDREHGVWLPRSQVEIHPKGERVRIGTRHGIVIHQPVAVTMPQWLAREKGLI